MDCAREGRADYSIIGDRDLLGPGMHEGTRIITPREFVELLDCE